MTAKPNFVVNTGLVHTKGRWSMISPSFPQSITHLRPLGGSSGMWTFFEGKLPPEAINNQELAQKLNTLNDKQIQDYCNFVQEKNLKTIYMLNSNDTVANSLWILQKFIDGASNIEAIEIGQELYLPKFTRINGPIAQGYIRQVTWDDYADYCMQIIPQIKALLPGVKILLHVAYESGSGAPLQRKVIWNNNIQQAITTYPNMADGLTVHLYEGSSSTIIGDEEDVVLQADLSQLDRWSLPLYWTETGQTQTNYTQEGLAKYRGFLRGIHDYCEDRNDGSIAGTHLLFLRKANKGHNIYGALYNEDGALPLVNELAGFPWNDEFGTVEPPVTPGPPVDPPVEPIEPPVEPPVQEPQPPIEEPKPETPQPETPIEDEPILVDLKLQYSSVVVWTQRLIFSDGSELLRQRNGRQDDINPLKDSNIGKPKSFFV